MAEQSSLELVGLEERNENQLPRNEIQKADPYKAGHDKAMAHDDDLEEHALGKGTGHGGHGHTVPKTYDSATRNRIIPQFDTSETAGGTYDKYGRAQNGGGGRYTLMAINKYNINNAYGVNSVDTSVNRADGQYYKVD